MPKRFQIVLTAAVLLGCRGAVAQQTTAPKTQSESNTVPGAKQLPDAPVAGRLPVPAATSTADSSSCSSSSGGAVACGSPKFWSSSNPNAQATVREDTLLRVRTDQPLSSRETRAGAPLTFTLSEDVVVDNTIIVPRGATVHGTAVETKHAGTLAGSAELTLKLTSLDLGGRTYPLYSYQFKVVGTSKAKPTETKVKGGAVIGAVVGGVFSGSAKGESSAVGKLAGMGTGAAVGAGVGAAASAVTPGPIVSIPVESQMDFHLASPISVVPVSAKEAARLSQGLHPGGPVLYVRGETP